MPVIEINWNPSDKHLRRFALLQVPFLLFVAWRISANTSTHAGSMVITAISLAIGIAGAIRPRVVHPLYVVWMGAVLPVGWLVSHLLLAVLFYLVVTPVGIIMRICRYDPMNRRFDRRASSYWMPRHEARETKRYFKQY